MCTSRSPDWWRWARPVRHQLSITVGGRRTARSRDGPAAPGAPGRPRPGELLALSQAVNIDRCATRRSRQSLTAMSTGCLVKRFRPGSAAGEDYSPDRRRDRGRRHSEHASVCSWRCAISDTGRPRPGRVAGETSGHRVGGVSAGSAGESSAEPRCYPCTSRRQQTARHVR